MNTPKKAQKDVLSSAGLPSGVSIPDAPMKLTGTLSTFDIVFSVLAFNAPLSVFVGFITVVIGYGNGLGAPAIYLGAGGLMLLFAVGFTTMSRYLPNPGAFYAYITAGLGKPMGLGAAFLAVASYFFILVGGYAFGGISLEALVRDVLGGPDLPWWSYVLAVMVIVSALGYFRITLSAKILTIFMCLEVVIIVAYNTVVLSTGGFDGINFQSFLPSNILSGSFGLAVIFGIVCFSGFEATAVFREEARDPDKTVPRATYIAIIFLTALYAVSSWVMIIGIGDGTVVEAAAADPTGTALSTVEVYLGRTVMDIVVILLCTSVFAANLATHNVTARYLYSLSTDRVFPAFLSTVHKAHNSPHRASLATTVIGMAFLIALVIAGAPGATLYAVLVGIGGYALIVLLLLTSAAVFWYFHKRPELHVNRWKTQIAPPLAVVGLGGALWLATENVAAMIGGDQVLANLLVAFFALCIVAGVVVALIFRRKNPTTYARIGRQEL